MAEFHWVGSTAGNINSLRWGNTSNWRVVQYGTPGSTAPGGTLARLIPATRLPVGGNVDTVNFGVPPHYYNAASLYQPARYNIFSPCLFGGVTTTTDRVWEGVTAGTATANRYGSLLMNIHPRYPFSRLGGYVDAQILSEWTAYLGVLTGITYSGWTLSSGTEYDDAQYTTFGGWYGGVTGGISFAQQTSYSIRTRGGASNSAHARTTVVLTGLTGASGGATGGAYDGTTNQVVIGSQPGSSPSGTVGNRTADGFLGQQFQTNGSGQVLYDTAHTVLSGNWNRVGTLYYAPSAGDIQLNGAKVNALTLKPTIYVTANSGNTGTVVQSISSPANSKFVLGNVYIDESSSLRYMELGNIQGHTYSSEVVVLGDIIPTGGFVCAAPAGPSAGLSGGVQYTNGSLVVESPAQLTYGDPDGAILRLGFAQYDGSTKSTTTIDKVYALQNTDVATRVVVDGPVTVSEFHLHGGTCEKGSGLQASASVVIDNLYLYGNAVYDQSTNSSHYNTTAKIRVMSNSASVKPGAQTTLDVGHIDNN